MDTPNGDWKTESCKSNINCSQYEKIQGVSYFSFKSDEFQSCKNQLFAHLDECSQFLLKNANFDSPLFKQNTK